MNRIGLKFFAAAIAMLICVTPQPAFSQDQTNALAVDAYLYAYPLVTMEMSRRVSTNIAATQENGTRAPMNQFAFLRTYPNASFTDVVAPNADTLYEIGWFDVSKEPIVIHTPALGGRYALFPMLSAWTNVFESPGTRTTGDAAQTFAVTGPGWSGSLPSGVREVKSPTALVWMIGRIYTDGTPADFAIVHKLQNEMSATPLSMYGKPYTPPAATVDPAIDMKTPIVEQVNALSGMDFFKIFASLLQANPPAAADAPMVAKLADLGIVPGQPLDTSKLSPAIVAAMNAAPAAALPRMQGMMKSAGRVENGWAVFTTLGDYGTSYDLRAFVALIGLGANLAKDAIYPATVAPLDGAKKYTIHFGAGQMPPAKAFWSITLYNAKQFFYDNSLNRYTVSERTPFVKNADGSVDVYVQHDSPGAAKEANWLPAPADKFSLIMRIYLPSESPPSIIDGTWTVPAVTPASP
ncbi:MAG TPA: DUF1254 domain-containing protein [Candidatus Acidoferrales bacterium]|nr:DUF1254 domain-containing protein [Candidatus Acidoferrales bacterium]